MIFRHWINTALIASVCIAASGSLGCRKEQKTAVDLSAAREGHATRLLARSSGNAPPDPPPAGIFELVDYPSPAGRMAAYLTPQPKDGGKHPIIIWLFGGFSNEISPLAWEDDIPKDNDQSASAYRRAGLAMMYPSLRGGHKNPGVREGLYGEVDDVLAAADYAASLPWVDAKRIYLGGHSTGGTLALLVAEADRKGIFRAVISYGPAEDVAGYGQAYVPFDVGDGKEAELRSPKRFLDSIRCPAFVIEGDGGNIQSLHLLAGLNRNPLVHFVELKDESHFSVLHPGNSVLAPKILADRGAECSIILDAAEIKAASMSSR